MTKTIHLIGAAIGIAAGNPGCAEGPKQIKANATLAPLNARWVDIIEDKPGPSGLAAMPIVADVCTKIAAHTDQCTRDKQPFLTIGGDHSCAIGTWSGAAHALREHGDLGLIWIDAHMDSHTPESSGSGNIHGMPVAALLGHGDASLTEISDQLPKIKPENICLIGIRCYEAPEKALLEKLGVRIYYAEEVQERGIDTVMSEALKQVTQQTCAFGITIDLDGLDPVDAPAVGTPVDGGIRAEHFLPTLESLKHHEQFIGAEIVEFNPSLGHCGKTEQLVFDLAEKLFD